MVALVLLPLDINESTNKEIYLETRTFIFQMEKKFDENN